MVSRLVKGEKGSMIRREEGGEGERERERLIERARESLTDWGKCSSQGTRSLNV